MEYGLFPIFCYYKQTKLNYLEYKSFHIFKSTVYVKDKFLEGEFQCQMVYIFVSDFIKLSPKRL